MSAASALGPSVSASLVPALAPSAPDDLAPAPTPASAPPTARDPFVDLARALATAAVVIGHWLVTAPVLGGDGTWHLATPLGAHPALAWITLLIQPLPVFFAIGGSLAAASLARAEDQGRGGWRWLAGRARRLLAPAAAALGVIAAVAAAAALAGLALGTVRTIVVACVQPLWFLAVYLALTALTPLARQADARWGWRVPLALAASVGLVDLLRYGPLAAAMPAWLGLLNLIPGWLFAYQCGIARASRPLRRRGLAALAGAGLAAYLFALACGYPPTPMGVGVEGRINSHPPSIVVVAAAAMFLAALWAAEPALRRATETARWAARVRGWVSPRAMELLCWHMAAFVAVSALGIGLLAALGPTPPGEAVRAIVAPDPAGGGYWLSRAVMLPLAGALLVLVSRPRRRAGARSPRPRPRVQSGR